MKKLLLIGALLVGCGGSPDALFASANPGGVDATVDSDSRGGDVVADELEDTGLDLGAFPDADAGPPDSGQPGVDVEAAAPDAQAVDVQDALPALDACPCYRNMAMDGYCTTERPEAWVCQSKCGLPGCTYDYAPQPGLACCPEPDAQ
jgi:hypothetical protein